MKKKLAGESGEKVKGEVEYSEETAKVCPIPLYNRR